MIDALLVQVEEQSDSAPFDSEEFVEVLLALPGEAEQHQFLARRTLALDAGAQDEVADLLKARADCFLRSDIRRCLNTANLILYLAQLTADPEHKALGLLAKANGHAIGLGEYQQAIHYYDEASAIYQLYDLHVKWASAQIGRVYVLTTLSRREEALRIGEQACQILAAYEAWFPLAKLTSNLAIIFFRLGEDARALALFEEAQKRYRQAGQQNSPGWLRAEFNRAIVLRNLGRFEASIEASKTAHRLLSQLGELVEAARAQQNLAITYFVLGRYNEALELLDQVRDIFLADGRQRDAILTDLFVSDCLLQLRRFDDVLAKCQRVRELFTGLGTRFEVGQAIVNEAIAYAGFGRFAEALASLTEARQLFEADGNTTWVAMTDLETAAVYLHQQNFEASLTKAEACITIFRQRDLPLNAAQAGLVAAQAASELGRFVTAQDLVQQALSFAESHHLASLAYQSHAILGQVADQRGHHRQALKHFDHAIDELERLRGRLMTEFRADFLQDKQVVYEAAVNLTLELGQPGEGLKYAERAKSRVLLDLLAFRVNLGVEARAPDDQPLVAELTRLRAERDRLYRRWESGEGTTERGGVTAQADAAHVNDDVLSLEGRITNLWHKLLIRNADYARDAALWHIRTEPIQPYLDADTLLIEFFVAQNTPVAFLVTADSIVAHRLPDVLAQVQSALRLFQLNLRSVPPSHASQRQALTENVRGLLRRLYDLLLEPFAQQLAPFKRLIIVPHSSLHYVPFHALYDGSQYVLEQFEISYLPSASFLHYCQSPSEARSGLVAAGYSFEKKLPYAVHEADAIAALWQGKALLESQATRKAVIEAASSCQILHLATHGDFRPDNPLFSGLALADGWLTTLDIFNLRCQASLVTLSACQTGRNVIGGGDELLGLMRAFLSAGAGSLLLSLWPVQDRASAHFMEIFYRKLADGWSKGTALQHTQRQFVNGTAELDESFVHPYFWAPFYLVGDVKHL